MTVRLLREFLCAGANKNITIPAEQVNHDDAAKLKLHLIGLSNSD